jgi:hypothetical protein
MEKKNFNPKIKDSIKNIYLSNENLLNIMFKYCSFFDILNISLVSKKFYKIIQNLDNHFRDLINTIFFSNYENYK